MLLALFSACEAEAQESPSPPTSPSPASARNVRISFLPPPLDGSISLGIYDTQGQLVRVLFREAEIEDFEAGSDALNTTWDGKNDAGENLPPGKYHARGYVVGNLQVDGVGFCFNDWVTDDGSPHIKKIENFARASERSLLLRISLASGAQASIATDLDGHIAGDWRDADSQRLKIDDLTSPEVRNLRVEGGKLFLDVKKQETPVAWPELIAPEDACYGRSETVWVIDQAAPGETHKEVKQFSRKGEFLRQLNFGPDEPAPRLIRASTTDDKLFLLEENEGMQRMRKLILLEAKNENGRSVSDWKVGFEKKIVAHKDFGIEDGKPVGSGGKTPPEKVSIKLQPNPLENEARVTAELSVGYDKGGSFLQTADGLPLESISETPNLSRVVLSPHGEKSLDVFQDDDAVVEQFRISGLDQMMAFDCGAFDLN